MYHVELPIIRPTAYMYIHNADLGEEKWEVFAEVVRRIYCEVGGFISSDKSLRDSKRYNKVMENGKLEFEDKKEN